MPTRVILFRCPEELASAIDSAAKKRGVTASQVIRRAVGLHLGIEAGEALPIGLAGADAETRQRVTSLGGSAGKKVATVKKSSLRNTNSVKALRQAKKKSAKK